MCWSEILKVNSFCYTETKVWVNCGRLSNIKTTKIIWPEKITGSYLWSYFPCHWHSLKLLSPSFCLWSFSRIMIRLWKSTNEVMTLCEINVSCWWQHWDLDLASSPPHLFFSGFKLISFDICTRATRLRQHPHKKLDERESRGWEYVFFWHFFLWHATMQSNCHWQKLQEMLQWDVRYKVLHLFAWHVSSIRSHHFILPRVEPRHIYDVMTIANVKVDFHKSQEFPAS